jgi:thymidylate synthase (FAD)
MGDDEAICQAARVSYGAGTKKTSDDRTLIRYLLRHRHTTPFEMCELKFMVKVPMDCWRQWIRHRTASVNEYSTRYSQAIDDRCRVGSSNWRAQSASNKQGSEGMVDTWPEGYKPNSFGQVEFPDTEDTDIGQPPDEPYDVDAAHLPGEPFTGRTPTPGEYLSDRESVLHSHIQVVYEERLEFGVAREVARKDLPLSTYTKAYWKIDLHNLLHFLSLRMDPHAQLEIRSYANVIGEEIVASLFPQVWEAFLDYKLNAMQLSALEVQALQAINCNEECTPISVKTFMKRYQPDAWVCLERCRERDECLAKLQDLRLVNLV